MYHVLLLLAAVVVRVLPMVHDTMCVLFGTRYSYLVVVVLYLVHREAQRRQQHAAANGKNVKS